MGDVLTDSDISGLFCSITELSGATPYRIDVSFNRRFKIWKEQVLPDRLMDIRKEQSVEYIHRMIDLLLADASRLTDRAIKENVYTLISTIKEIDLIVEDEIKIYLDEIDKIKLSRLK